MQSIDSSSSLVKRPNLFENNPNFVELGIRLSKITRAIREGQVLNFSSKGGQGFASASHEELAEARQEATLAVQGILEDIDSKFENFISTFKELSKQSANLLEVNSATADVRKSFLARVDNHKINTRREALLNKYIELSSNGNESAFQQVAIIDSFFEQLGNRAENRRVLERTRFLSIVESTELSIQPLIETLEALNPNISHKKFGHKPEQALLNKLINIKEIILAIDESASSNIDSNLEEIIEHVSSLYRTFKQAWNDKQYSYVRMALKVLEAKRVTAPSAVKEASSYSEPLLDISSNQFKVYELICRALDAGIIVRGVRTKSKKQPEPSRQIQRQFEFDEDLEEFSDCYNAAKKQMPLEELLSTLDMLAKNSFDPSLLIQKIKDLESGISCEDFQARLDLPPDIANSLHEKHWHRIKELSGVLEAQLSSNQKVRKQFIRALEKHEGLLSLSPLDLEKYLSLIHSILKEQGKFGVLQNYSSLESLIEYENGIRLAKTEKEVLEQEEINEVSQEYLALKLKKILAEQNVDESFLEQASNLMLYGFFTVEAIDERQGLQTNKIANNCRGALKLGKEEFDNTKVSEILEELARFGLLIKTNNSERSKSRRYKLNTEKEELSEFFGCLAKVVKAEAGVSVSTTLSPKQEKAKKLLEAIKELVDLAPTNADCCKKYIDILVYSKDKARQFWDEADNFTVSFKVPPNSPKQFHNFCINHISQDKKSGRRPKVRPKDPRFMEVYLDMYIDKHSFFRPILLIKQLISEQYCLSSLHIDDRSYLLRPLTVDSEAKKLLEEQFQMQFSDKDHKIIQTFCSFINEDSLKEIKEEYQTLYNALRTLETGESPAIEELER